MALGLNLNLADTVNSVATTYNDYKTGKSINKPDIKSSNNNLKLPSMNRTLSTGNMLVDAGIAGLNAYTNSNNSNSLPNLPGVGNTIGMPNISPSPPFTTPVIPNSLTSNPIVNLTTNLLTDPEVTNSIKKATGLDMTLPSNLESMIDNDIAKDLITGVSAIGSALAIKSGVLGMTLSSCVPNISLPDFPKLGTLFGLPKIDLDLPSLKDFGIKSLLKNALCNMASNMNQLPSITSDLAKKVGETTIARDLVEGMSKIENIPHADDVLYGLRQSGLLNSNYSATPIADKNITTFIDKSIDKNKNIKDPKQLVENIKNTSNNKLDTINTITETLIDPIPNDTIDISKISNVPNITNLFRKSNMDDINLPNIDEDVKILTDKKAIIAGMDNINTKPMASNNRRNKYEIIGDALIIAIR